MKNAFVYGGLLLILAFAGWAFSAPVDLGANERTLTITQGESVSAIAKKLASSGIIRSDMLFRTYFWVMYSSKTIKSGDYRFSGSLTLPAVSTQLIAGIPKREKTLRVIEGWTAAQIAEYFEREGVGTRGQIDTALNKDWSARFRFIKQGVSLEGYLFPDTYRVFYDARPEDVIEKMLSNFDRKVTTDMRARLTTVGYSLRDVVILASILEREVRSDADRARAADLFYRRLSAGMPLQADSTVNYITGKNAPSASMADIAVDSPYNTYKQKGLPPGPISNPGLSALNAALHPEKNPYWYFLTPKDGSVIYAKTLDEQVRNKRKFLRNP